MSTETKQPIFPYVSYPTLKAFICHLHDTVVTDKIDNTMMPRKLSGSARATVMVTLKSLKLIDDQNNATSNLKELADAYNQKEWPQAVKKCILSAYDDITKGIDLKSVSRKQVEDMFGDLNPQVKEKCIRFFLTANKEAGIEYSPHLKIRKRSVTPKKRTNSVVSPKSAIAKETPQNEQKPDNAFDQPIPIDADFPCFIRIPRNITVGQANMVKAAVAFIEAMAKQNEASKQ
ncbi:MAG: hypothetical protein WCZ89_03420 [Phycisphaerae bacterium]